MCVKDGGKLGGVSYDRRLMMNLAYLRISRLG